MPVASPASSLASPSGQDCDDPRWLSAPAVSISWWLKLSLDGAAQGRR